MMVGYCLMLDIDDSWTLVSFGQLMLSVGH